MFQYSNLYFKKLPRHWKMSILHIFNVTDSWWKKSHWATSSVCLCHRISSTAAFSQMMRKLLSQLQHPLFFFFSPLLPILSWCCQGPVPALAQNESEVPVGGSAELAPLARSKSQPDIAIARPGPAVQRPRLPGREMRECHGKKNPPCSSGPAQHPGLTCPVTGAALRV